MPAAVQHYPQNPREPGSQPPKYHHSPQLVALTFSKVACVSTDNTSSPGLAVLTFWMGPLLVVRQGWPVHGREFSSIAGLHLLCANSTTTTHTPPHS